MINVLLEFTDSTGDKFTKRIVIQQPAVRDFVMDCGLLWGVIRVEHSTSDPIFKATVSGMIKGNSHWELCHERGWELEESNG